MTPIQFAKTLTPLGWGVVFTIVGVMLIAFTFVVMEAGVCQLP